MAGFTISGIKGVAAGAAMGVGGVEIANDVTNSPTITKMTMAGIAVVGFQKMMHLNGPVAPKQFGQGMMGPAMITGAAVTTMSKQYGH